MMAGSMQYKIPFIKPVFPAPEVMAEDYKKIIASNWFTNFGPYERELSIKATEFVGKDLHGTTVANCTLGLEIALRTLANPDKKYVIIPSFTFAAVAEVVINSGLVPVFIDIEKDSWQPSITQAKEFIDKESTDVAGIILPNVFGVGNKAIDKWEDLAQSKQIPLIIDSAAGFGSKYSDDEFLGGRGDCEVFSFHATKPFAIGEGGLIVSKSKELIDKLRKMQNFGFNDDRTVGMIGTNAKLQELSCAIGLRQLESYADRLELRRSIIKKYQDLLSTEDVQFQENVLLSTGAFISVTVTNKEKIFHALHDAGVQARAYYSPTLHKIPVITEKSITSFSLQNTEDVENSILSLPVIEEMNADYIELIVDVIKKGIKEQ